MFRPTTIRAPTRLPARRFQKALSRGLAWNQALITGEVLSVSELARREKLCRRYVSRLIQLSFLAPDVIRAIGRGHIPPTLSVDLLKRGFPLDWNKQRQMLGFARNPTNRD